VAGFVPGRDRLTIEALHPDEAQRVRTLESEERQATLDKTELAELEGYGDEAIEAEVATPTTSRRKSILARLLRR
jgi:hypothetical protein